MCSFEISLCFNSPYHLPSLLLYSLSLSLSRSLSHSFFIFSLSLSSLCLLIFEDIRTELCPSLSVVWWLDCFIHGQGFSLFFYIPKCLLTDGWIFEYLTIIPVEQSHANGLIFNVVMTNYWPSCSPAGRSSPMSLDYGPPDTVMMHVGYTSLIGPGTHVCDWPLLLRISFFPSRPMVRQI